MTVGVKIVQYPVGTTTITEDLFGYTPKAVLFFGGFAGTNGYTRSFGASDGTNQWSCSDWRRAGIISRFSADGGRFGGATRTDRCFTLLNITGTTPKVVGLDTSCHVSSFAANTINLVWDSIGTAAAPTPFTAVIFYGPQIFAQAGVCGASTDTSKKVTTPWEPGCVFLSSYGPQSNPQQFATAVPTHDNGISSFMAFGWATFPEPAFDPATASAGTTNTTSFGQQSSVGDQLLGGGISFTQGAFYANAPFAGSNVSRVINASDGFTHHVTSGSFTNTSGYLALNWTAGRFVSGYMAVPNASVGGSFGRWGGTFNGANVDTNPSNHANPSFLLLQGMDAINAGGLSGPNNQTLSVAALDSGGDVKGFAGSGSPDGNPALPLSTPSTANMATIGTKFTLLKSDNTVLTQMTVTSWDGDGISVTFAPAMPDAERWIYMAMSQDAGVLANFSTMAVTEESDTVDIDLFANWSGVQLRVTEAKDTFHAATVITCDVTMAVTESPDVFESGGHGHGVITPIIGEYIYVPEDNQTFSPAWDQCLPIIILNESEVTSWGDEQLASVPGEVRPIYVPPVESGSWF